MLVLFDTYSKWIEAKLTKGQSAAVVKDVLMEFISNFGVPEVIVSDNGPGFASEELKEFARRWGIYWKYSPGYHPASNGPAERAVGSVKRMLKKNVQGSLKERLLKAIYWYRVTPNGTDNRTPGERLLNRKIRTPWSLLSESRHQEQPQQNSEARFAKGSPIWVRNYPHKDWIKAEVLAGVGSRIILARLANGRVRNVHLDHIRRRAAEAASVVRTEEGMTGMTGGIYPVLHRN